MRFVTPRGLGVGRGKELEEDCQRVHTSSFGVVRPEAVMLSRVAGASAAVC